MSDVSTATRRLTKEFERLLCFFALWPLIPVISVSFYQFSLYFYDVSCSQILDFNVDYLKKISEGFNIRQKMSGSKIVQNFNARHVLQVTHLI